MQLRDYQQDIVNQIQTAWMINNFVAAVAPTGSGKTVIFGNILSNHTGSSCAIAHRQELVSQISLALARYGVYHKIIAPKALIHDIVQLHIDEIGYSYYNPSAVVAVAGVDTLIRRIDSMKEWLNSVTLWVTDECHHILIGNKWGKACDLFPNAKGLGVTATFCRTDGAGLGAHADGVFNTLIEGPSMRELINRGFLTDYRVFAPPSDLDLEGVKITNTGEYSPTQVDDRVNHSHLFGDVVKHYLRIALGKLGVTFAHNVDAAIDIAARYNAAGVPAEVVHAKTPLRERTSILKRFKRRELLQLVNVDLFGEGFDLPAIEVVSMARPTHSYGLYVQQFGRALRLMIELLIAKNWDQYTDEQRLYYIATSLKPTAIIIDHVGNIKRHGLPDAPRAWSLDREERRSRNKHDPDKIPLKTCKVCSGLYEAIYNNCPYCGAIDIPAERVTIKQVDGDLLELDPATLALMRGEVIDVNEPLSQKAYLNLDPRIRISQFKKYGEIQIAQKLLRKTIEWFGGYHQWLGVEQQESWKRFYFRFNIDVLTATTLKTKDALELQRRIEQYLNSKGVMVL